MFGTVKWFNEQKGYGFIVKQPLGGEVFAHIKEVRSRVAGVTALLPGDEVDFDVFDSDKGERARNVVVLKRHHRDPHSPMLVETGYVHD